MRHPTLSSNGLSRAQQVPKLTHSGAEKAAQGGKVAAAETGRHAEDPHHPCKKPGVAARGSNPSAGQQRPEDPQVCHGSISLDSCCAPGPERDSLQAVR